MCRGLEVLAILSQHFCYLCKDTPLLFSACWWGLVFCILASDHCLEGDPLMDKMEIFMKQVVHTCRLGKLVSECRHEE